MSLVRCYQLHQLDSGCSQEIPLLGGWLFCPRCGRSTAHIRLGESQFEVAYQQASERSVRVSNVGLTPAQCGIVLVNQNSDLRISLGSSHSFSLEPAQARDITLQWGPLKKSKTLGSLTISSHDSEVGEGDAWEKRKPRRQSTRVRADVNRPALVEISPELLIFSGATPRRTILIRNFGDDPVFLDDMHLPRGYTCGEIENIKELEGGQRLALPVHWNPKLRSLPEEEVEFVWSNAQVSTVQLHCLPTPPKRQVLQAVFGIDFGTAFTSIAYRRLLHAPRTPDEVQFLRPLGEKERFRTRLWISRSDGELVFGEEASRRYEANPSTGYLLRELKTFLREETPEQAVFPESRRGEAARFLRDRFGEQWRLSVVIAFLDWLYRSCVEPQLQADFGSTNIDVQFVFSLPVLDYATSGTLYQQQLDQMRICVEAAGFAPEKVVYGFEPVCASLGLLRGKDQTWPRLGDAAHPALDGQGLVVFDSGGGTTDVILTRVQTASDGTISLRVERCLGVGGQSETFGGEVVTSRLLESLTNYRTITEYWSGKLELNRVLGIVGHDPEQDLDEAEETPETFSLEQRDQAEKLKIELALATTATLSRGEAVLQKSLLEYLVKAPLRSLEGELKKLVFDQEPVSKPYFLCVGGNSALPAFEDWAERFMGGLASKAAHRHLRLPESDRQLAVAFGAVWLPDARIANSLPYALRASVDASVLLEVPAHTTQDVLPVRRQYALNPGDELEVEVLAQVSPDEEWKTVERRVLHNPADQLLHCDIDIALQSAHLQAHFRWIDHQSPEKRDRLQLLNYPL